MPAFINMPNSQLETEFLHSNTYIFVVSIITEKYNKTGCKSMDKKYKKNPRRDQFSSEYGSEIIRENPRH